MSIQVDGDAVRWCAVNGREFTYRFPADNHTPTRAWEQGVGYSYAEDRHGRPGIVLPGMSDYRERVFLVDDGHSVTPFYAAGWSLEHDWVVMVPFPTGERFAEWFVGARKAYHLKVTYL